MEVKIVAIWWPVFFLSVYHLQITEAEEGKNTKNNDMSTTEHTTPREGTKDSQVVDTEEESTKSRNDTTSVWRVENGNVVPINLRNYADFDASKVYIIKHREESEVGGGDGDGISEIKFYWVGERSSELDAVFAVTFAVSDTNFVKIVRREAVGLESDSFKTIFKNVGSSVGEKMVERVEENATRMIVMKKNRGVAIDLFDVQEIEFSPKCLKGDHDCFVAFNSLKVYAYCEKYTDDHGRLLTRKLADILRKKVMPHASEFVFFHRDEDRDKFILERFTNEINRLAQKIKDHKVNVAKTSPKAAKKGIFSPTRISGFFRSSPEKSEKNEHDQREEQDTNTTSKIDNITVLQIYDDTIEHAVKVLELNATTTLMFPFRSQDCYLVDSGIGHIGSLAWLGKESSVNERKECARRAERLLREKKDSDARPLIIVDERGSDLKEFPRRFGTIKNLIVLMRNLNISWEDVLMPVHNNVNTTSTH